MRNNLAAEADKPIAQPKENNSARPVWTLRKIKMIGNIKNRIRRLEARLEVHPGHRKQTLPAWLRSELEGQGWLFDSEGVIFVPKNETNSIREGASDIDVDREDRG
jgi:hypothetical protein